MTYLNTLFYFTHFIKVVDERLTFNFVFVFSLIAFLFILLLQSEVKIYQSFCHKIL